MISDYDDGDGGIALPLDDPAFASDLEVQPGDYRDPKFFNIRFPWMDNKMDEASRISRYKLSLFYQPHSGMVLGWFTSFSNLGPRYKLCSQVQLYYFSCFLI